MATAIADRLSVAACARCWNNLPLSLRFLNAGVNVFKQRLVALNNPRVHGGNGLFYLQQVISSFTTVKTGLGF